MWTLRLIGIMQIFSILILLGLKSGTPGSWTATALYCLVALLTVAYFSLRRLQYSGWLTSSLNAYALYMVPLGATLFFVVPRLHLELFIVFACSAVAEHRREQHTGEKQLGWIAFPILSATAAVLLNMGTLTDAVHLALIATALCSTLLLYWNAGRTIDIERESELVVVNKAAPEASSVRSIGRAA
jgi:hypothetical protein